jgi:hypothetical protein
VTTEPLRPLLIVSPDRAVVADWLAHRLQGIIPVILDRRRGDRRRQEGAAASDRRRTQRRRPPSSVGRERGRTLGYQLVYTLPDQPDPERVLVALAYCGECETLLEFEMPRFVEVPARVEVNVLHEFSTSGVAHPVELEAFQASGRLLLACRLDARIPWVPLQTDESVP